MLNCTGVGRHERMQGYFNRGLELCLKLVLYMNLKLFKKHFYPPVQCDALPRHNFAAEIKARA